MVISRSRPGLERFEAHALGRPYHAALVDLRGRSDPHGHQDYCEVMVVLDGDGSQDLGPGVADRVQSLRAGDVIFLRTFDPQTGRDQHAISGPVRFYNIAFPAGRWRSFAELAGVGPDWYTAERPPHRRLPESGLAAAESVCAAALERFRAGPRPLDLIRFWTDLIPLLGLDPAPGTGPPSGTPDWLADACAAMRRETNLRGGVPRLLELARVSPAHLARSMRRYYDTTATAYVSDLRLEQAATLLTTTMRPVAEIADACGFASPAYFTRRFQAAHGMAPRDFRRAAQHAFVPRRGG
ncbi:helix-turn-helix domain-containing protein [Microlunatus sp. GCM10028923]|uniref:helix-turn-helix domain-containing protein n=1 Tax=Microlunatus sp. GCM10028923 TaxID=3273400 RepID=UPI003621AD08